MYLVIGLGPIGGGAGARLAELGRPVCGLDLDERRAREWSEKTGAPAVTDMGGIEWPAIDTVIIAVRMADQVRSTMESLVAGSGGKPLTVYVLTTLSIADATAICSGAPENWRLFEAPVSGGAGGAREGTMTVFLAGPPREEADEALLSDIAGKVFGTDEYGAPAVLKLTNNALGALNAVSTAHMLRIAARNGVAPATFLDVVGASSGQSWMSDHFTVFPDDLLFKDAGLLRDDLGSLPVIDLDLDPAAEIAAARELLGP
ncbi:NAD(P)-binding domain-containing protein [Saccharomonospora sp. NPDC006951]